MADIPQRTEHENQISNDLIAAFNSHRDKHPGSVDWLALENQIREDLAQRLLAIYLLMLHNFESDFDFTMDTAGRSGAQLRSVALGQRYARLRAQSVASTMTRNMRREYEAVRNILPPMVTQNATPTPATPALTNVSGAAGAADDFESIAAAADEQAAESTTTTTAASNTTTAANEEFTQAIDTIFSESRASAAAATEATAAASAAEIQAAEEYQLATGVELVAIWNTEGDESVCPICEPLDGEPQEMWDGEFPGGPPAHPNCRCFLTHIPAEDESLVG